MKGEVRRGEIERRDRQREKRPTIHGCYHRERRGEETKEGEESKTDSSQRSVSRSQAEGEKSSKEEQIHGSPEREKYVPHNALER